MKRRPDLLAGEDLLPAARQKRSCEKRDRLKAAALALFGEKGYTSTSIEEIAARACLATGGFYQHFRSKRQLLLALMDEWLQRLDGLELRRQTEGSPRERLRALLTHAFSTDMKYVPVYRAWQEAAMADPDLARKQSAIHAWTTARVMGVFKWLLSMPGARSGVDLVGVSRAMDALFWSLLAQAPRLTKVELRRWIDAATHLIYHALFVD